MENAWEGLTGNQRVSGANVIENFNPDFKYAGGVEKFVGGMIAEIALDPTTYISLGAGAMAKGATTTGVKALGTADDVTKVLKTTKTADQALDAVRAVDAVSDVGDTTRAVQLLKASKAYRAADTLDTIANPLKLVPMGVKKAGGAAMKGIEKVNPNAAKSLRKIGDELSQTFSYKKFLKKKLGKNVFENIENQDRVAQALENAAHTLGEDQAKYINEAVKIIKKDPSKMWTVVSNVDGSVTTRNFLNMTDDEIVAELNQYLINEVYFARPTVLNEGSIRNMIKNNGKLMLPVQDFKNPEDLETFKQVIKELVDDPDSVSIERYVQQGTEEATGYIIDIGEKNAKQLDKVIKEIDSDVAKYADEAAKATDKYGTQYKEVQATRNKINADKKTLSEVEGELSSYADDIAYNKKLSQSARKSQRRVNTIKKKYEKALEKATKKFANDPEKLAAYKKKAALEEAAEVRRAVQGDSLLKIEGGLTDEELAAEITRLKSNYVGKEVIADGATGRIVKSSSKSVAVEFADGTVKNFKPNEITSVFDVDEAINRQIQFNEKYASKSLEDTVGKIKESRKDLKRNIALSEANLNRKTKGSYARAYNAVEVAKENLDEILKKQAKVKELNLTRELIPYEAPRIEMQEIQKAAQAQKQFQELSLGIRHQAGEDITKVDKYAAYVPKVLTPEGRAYLLEPRCKE